MSDCYKSILVHFISKREYIYVSYLKYKVTVSSISMKRNFGLSSIDFPRVKLHLSITPLVSTYVINEVSL